MSQMSEMRKLERELRKRGYACIRGKGHMAVMRDGKRVTTTSCTPGGGRWKANLLGEIRRWERANGVGVVHVRQRG
jgi:hypothetical protein